MPRIFIAVPISETVRTAIHRKIRQTKDALPHTALSNVRWVAQDQYHITLRFLGDITETQVQAVAAAVEKASTAQEATAEFCAKATMETNAETTNETTAEATHEAAKPINLIRLHARGIGAFPHMQRARVVWVGVQGDVTHLTQRQRQIESNLCSQGFDPSDQQFKPHVTIARLRSPGPVPTALRELNDYDFGTWNVDRIQIIESHLTSSGPRYAVRYSLPLNAR